MPPGGESIKAALALIEQDASKILGLAVGKHADVKPGDHIPKADAQSPPALTFPAVEPGTDYLVVGLDLDAPFPSFGVLGPVLHWIQPSLRADASTPPTGTYRLAHGADARAVADWAGPSPPPGSGAHRYVFVLYAQPRGFDVDAAVALGGGKKKQKQKLGTAQRVRWDLDAWGRRVGLGAPVAVNWFRCN
ncbi:putative protease inhibitor [Xylariomycetidae sp. FL0641]|nr:putative protease inhibitor [Xylariomycetidae sp. FL0641]